jgi:hypothetical protein
VVHQRVGERLLPAAAIVGRHPGPHRLPMTTSLPAPHRVTMLKWERAGEATNEGRGMLSVARQALGWCNPAVRLDLDVVSAPKTVPSGRGFRIRVRVTNRGGTEIMSREPHAVKLAYHCYADDPRLTVFEGRRTELPVIGPGAAVELDMELQAPSGEGKLLFRLALVQEGVRWFDARPLRLYQDVWIEAVKWPEAIDRRLFLCGTPRSGNTWLRLMLQAALGASGTAVHTIEELNWRELPDSFILQMHLHHEGPILKLLRELEFQPILIIRHPLDVLISILHFCTFEEQTARWLGGEGGTEARIKGLTPADPEFLEYTLSARAEALLSISPEWLRAGSRMVRYEDLVATPAETLQTMLGERDPVVPFETVVNDCKIEKLRNFSQNHHFWRGQPGVWRSLIPRSQAKQIYARHQAVFEALGYNVDGATELSPAEIQATWRQL